MHSAGSSNSEALRSHVYRDSDHHKKDELLVESKPVDHPKQVVLLVESKRIMQLYLAKKFIEFDVMLDIHSDRYY